MADAPGKEVFCSRSAVRRSLSACSGGKIPLSPASCTGDSIPDVLLPRRCYRIFTERRVISAISPSSRKIKRRVTGNSASWSRSDKVFRPYRVITSGLPERAASSVSGWRVSHDHRAPLCATQLRDRAQNNLTPVPPCSVPSLPVCNHFGVGFRTST